MSRHRAYTFTCNNYTKANIDEIKSIECRYICFGKEVAPETGTRHLQGYIYFDNPRAFKAVIKTLRGCHVEVAKGTPEQNYNYCSKDGDFYEHGIKPLSQKEKGDSERQRWTLARQAAINGNYSDIPDDLYIRYQGSFKRMRAEDRPLPDALPTQEYYGIWIHGVSGAGKSHKARTEFAPVYLKGINKWWDGYIPGHNVLIEEFEPSHSRDMISYIKQWTDKWPFSAETKGGTVTLRPPLIIITSNHSIEDCFMDVNLTAVIRRFKIIYMDKVYEPTMSFNSSHTAM